MRSLGLDIGDKRTGVAISDTQGILATPLTVLRNKDVDASVHEILRLAEKYKVNCIVVGLPRRLNGEIGKQASKVTAFAEKLIQCAKSSELNQLHVQLWDERLSTKAAERLKTATDSKESKRHSRAKKEAKSHRFPIKAQVDAIAAAFILQGFLDSQRQSDNEGSCVCLDA